MHPPMIIGAPPKGFRGGLWLGFSNNDLDASMSPDMYNYLVDDSGLTKRKGCIKDNAVKIGNGIGATGLHRHFDGSDYKTYMKIGASVYEVAPAGESVSRLADLDEAAEVEFESWIGLCFCADGIDLYQASTGDFSAAAWLDEDGASTSGWSLLPTPVALVLHKEHLWWFDKNSSRIGFTVRGYYDRVFENTIDAGNYGSWVACDQDDGQYLTALARMPLADMLMAFKRNKSFFIEGDYDPVSNTLAVRPGPPCGAYSPKTAITCPDGFIRWVGPEGAWEYSHVTGPRRISRQIDYELRRILEDNQPKICAGYWNRYFFIAYPYGASPYNNRMLAYDTERECWVQIRAWNVARLCQYKDNTLHAAWSNAGYVKKLFDGTSDEGAVISCRWKTPYLTPGHGYIWALKFLRAQAAYTDMTLRYASEPQSNLNDTVRVTHVSATGLVLGSWVLGTSTISSLDSLGYYEFEDHPEPGQFFRQMQFSFEESSKDTHGVDYLEVNAVPVRKDG